jgi:hypothetical protein
VPLFIEKIAINPLQSTCSLTSYNNNFPLTAAEGSEGSFCYNHRDLLFSPPNYRQVLSADFNFFLPGKILMVDGSTGCS